MKNQTLKDNFNTISVIVGINIPRVDRIFESPEDTFTIWVFTQSECILLFIIQ